MVQTYKLTQLCKMIKAIFISTLSVYQIDKSPSRVISQCLRGLFFRIVFLFHLLLLLIGLLVVLEVAVVEDREQGRHYG